jgi:SAM-dependent methyltransferase
MPSTSDQALAGDPIPHDSEKSAAGGTRPADLAMACRICGASTDEFFNLEGVPVCCNILWPSRQEAARARRGDIRLTFCHGCGHIYNSAFDPARLTYGANYDNSLHFSPRFQQYARELAARLVETYDLHKKTVIEIGCGNAEFLALLCALGPNRGIGFDPSFIAGRADTTAGDGIEIVADNYSERYANRSCDLLCSRHMLEHVPDPLAIVTSVSHTLKGNSRAAIYFEVPNALFTLREKGIWDVIYEHCSYFTPQSIRYLFADAGFAILNVQETFGRQFLSLEGLVAGEAAQRSDAEKDSRLPADVTAFSAFRERLFNDWNARFNEMRRSGQRPVVWGAGAKGTMFLNAFAAAGLVEYVVDINPNKQGKYVAGTGQRIVSPNELTQIRPDLVILMNPVYGEEVRRQVSGLGVDCPILGV